MTQQNHITTKELMDRLDTNEVGVWHCVQKGLPAETFDHHIDRWRKLQVHWIDPDGPNFERQIHQLRFWILDVERWENGGAKAVAEARRLKFPLKALKSEPELWQEGTEEAIDLSAKPVAEAPLPTKKKRKLKKYILETRQEFVRYYEICKNHYSHKRFSWCIKHKLTKNVRWPDGTVISRGTFYEWRALCEDEKLFD